MADFTLSDVIRHSSRRLKDKVALICPHENKTLTYREIGERSSKLANALKDKFGVEYQDPVCIISPNTFRYPEFYFAMSKIGAITSPIGHMFQRNEFIPVINNTKSKVLFYSESVKDKVESIKSELTFVLHYVLLGDQYEELIAPYSSEVPNVDVKEDAVISLFLTSGTTGTPKAVMKTHKAIRPIFTAPIPIGKMIIYNDFAWIGGFSATMLALAGGATCIIVPRYEVNDFNSMILEHKPNVIFTLPIVLRNLISAPEEVINTVKENCKFLFYGGGLIPVELIQSLIKLVHPVPVGQYYGQSESGMLTSLTPFDHVLDPTPKQLERLASCGRSSWDSEIKIIDPETGKELTEPFQHGEIICRSTGNMIGYYNNPKATSETLKNGWLYTGDAGYFDEDDYLFIKSRVKDMIVLEAGINVYPIEIEDVIESLLSTTISDCTVVGFGHPEVVGEKIVLFAVRNPQSKITEEEVLQVLKDRLAAFKVPHLVVFRDSLPYNSNGKCLKRLLQQDQDIRNTLFGK